MNQDEEHLRLLSVFHYVVAGLAAMFACIPIMYVIMGLVMLLHAQSFGPQKDQPPAFLGILLLVMGSVMVLFGWAFAVCIAYSGRCLGHRRHYMFCMVMAGVACMFMPFGTILGVFTIIVLVRPTVKPLFNGMTPPAFAK